MSEPFDLTVVGEGELRAEYEAQAASLGIAAKVHFLGRVDDDQLRDAYAKAGIYVLPSDFARNEGGFTLTALEAMASGLPVVLADGAGQVAREAAQAGAGIRTPAGDPKALRDAIEVLIADEALRADMGKRAREFVERRHSWDVITDARRAVYAEVAAEASASRSR
jgi:glycosyltransferase involved in cell wall biosynthesis